MFFKGVHRTNYTYSDPVFLDPHTFRLWPRSDPRQTVQGFSVEISPGPEGSTQGVDAFGNSIILAWFSGTHQHLGVTTRFVVETQRENPFDFIIPGEQEWGLPPTYAEAERAALGPYVVARASERVVGLVRDAVDSSGRELVGFLAELCKLVHERCETVVRPEGDALPAETTLEAGSGSCRDLAVVYVEACRHAGVAARFVSGYQAGVSGNTEPELHAWAGAYVPGVGWRGYDPTLGLAVADEHVTLAAASSPAGAAPATGTYRGTGVTSVLETAIELTASVEPLG